jgi:hypothetical protein
MQQRIDQLEGLVKKLIARRQDIPANSMVFHQDNPKPGTGFVMTAVASGTGTTVIDGGYSVYKGEDDWYDVLQEVSCFSFLLCSSFLSCV